MLPTTTVTTLSAKTWKQSNGIQRPVQLIEVSLPDYNLVAPAYLSYATLTIVGAEHILTFDHEYNCLWKRKRNAASWLFLINRYALLVAAITYAIPWTSETCTNAAYQVIFAVWLTLPSLITAVFSALRIFALLEGRRILPGIILLFSLVAAALNAYFQTQVTGIYDLHTPPGPPCNAFPSGPSVIDSYGMGIVPICLLVADLIAIVATWTKTYHHVRQAVSLGIPTVAKIFLRDGSLYFLALLALTVVQFICVMLRTVHFAEDALFFSKMMPNVVLGRFLISINRFTDHETLSLGQPSRPIRFASHQRRFHDTIISMAAPLGERVDYEAEEPCSDGEDNEVAPRSNDTADVGNYA